MIKCNSVMTNESQLNMELINQEFQRLQTEKELSDCRALEILVGVYGPKEIANFLNWLGLQNNNAREK